MSERGHMIHCRLSVTEYDFWEDVLVCLWSQGPLMWNLNTCEMDSGILSEIYTQDHNTSDIWLITTYITVNYVSRNTWMFFLSIPGGAAQDFPPVPPLPPHLSHHERAPLLSDPEVTEVAKGKTDVTPMQQSELCLFARTHHNSQCCQTAAD